MLPLILTAALAQPALQPDLPTITITHDDTPITQSCRVLIPPGTTIPDANNNGVIHIETDNITVEFIDNATLAGAAIDNNWNTLTGIGVRILNADNVTLKNPRVLGYKIAVLATHADGLTIDTADLSDNYRQRLGSTPLREDPADWLFPHQNDNREWLINHGAALAVERSDNVTIRNLRVRNAQNGIVLDRVNNSKIYDNDCSFLSGWGLALWRSSDNTIAQNAFDFCVRGHSEGIYNRGQDSAGILFFEQCNRNTVFHNSATHSGDGFFGFAGREALGETPRPENAEWSYERIGCNDNFFYANHFSYAPAHGWEMTFSEGNRLWGNTFTGNAICGIWAGYSSYTRIEFNTFEANGAMPYGDQGGAINIEHGSHNLIRANTFTNNTTAVRLWWDNDENLLQLPGVKAAYAGVSNNTIARNALNFDDTNPFESALFAHRHEGRPFRGVWLQNEGDPDNFDNNAVFSNKVTSTHPRFTPNDFEPSVPTPATSGRVPGGNRPHFPAPGKNNPINARAHLAGRHNIIMNEWGPWDHESPMLRLRQRTADAAVYDLFGVDEEINPAFNPQGTSPKLSVHTAPTVEAAAPFHHRITITHPEPGVHPYDLTLNAGDFSHRLTGTLLNARWEARVWSWSANPLDDPTAWRAEAQGDQVVHVTLPALDFDFRNRGPADLDLISADAANNAGITADRFAIIAETTIPLPAGTWRIATTSDDGIRVRADGNTIIERWTIHGPTPDQATITLDTPRDVHLEVEHFEHDGWAALSLTIEPANN